LLQLLLGKRKMVLERRPNSSAGSTPRAAMTAAAAAAVAATKKKQQKKKEKEAAAAAAAAPPPSLSALASARALEEATCGICLELVAAAHAVSGCGHVFCGTCLAKAVSVSLVSSLAAASSAAAAGGERQPRCPQCPQCRAPMASPPTRVRVLDNMVAGLAAEKSGDVSERVALFEGNGGGGGGGGGSGSGGSGGGRARDATADAVANGYAGPRAPNAADAARIFAALSSPRSYRRFLQQLSPPLRTPASLEEEGEEGEEGEDFDDEEEEGDDEGDEEGEEGEEEEGEEDDPPGFLVPLQGDFFGEDFLAEMGGRALRALEVRGRRFSTPDSSSSGSDGSRDGGSGGA